MSEVLEDHVRTHLVDAGSESGAEDAREQLIDVLRSYLK